MKGTETNFDGTGLSAGNRFPPDSRIRVAETGSTNADVLAWVAAGDPPGSVLVADYQAAGRGRLDRTWEAKPGDALLTSFLIDGPEVDGLLPLALGLAALQVVHQRGAVSAGLKWPNDLMVGPQKLAGILVEAVHADGSITAAAAGIGMNLLAAPTDAISLQVALEDPGNSEPATPVVGAEILHELCGAFDGWLDVLGQGTSGRSHFLDAYRDGCVTIGQQVKVDKIDGSSFDGVATGIDEDGRLLVNAEGSVVAVQAGDVHHLRPSR